MPLRSIFFPSFPAGRIGWALLALRVVAGMAFFLHGAQKMARPFSWMGPDAGVPGVLQFLAAFSECFGGLAWIVGLLTPLATLGIGCTMLVATFMVHIGSRGDPFVKLPGATDAVAALYGLPLWLVRAGGPGGSYELALVFLAIAAALLLAGPGAYSLDARLFGRARRTPPGRDEPAPVSPAVARSIAPGGFRVREKQ